MTDIIEIGGMKFDAKDVERMDEVVQFAKKEHLDAGETAFLLRELTVMAARAQETRYLNLMARQVFNVESGMGSGIENINHEIYDYSGEAKVIGDNATDYPLAGTKVDEMTTPVRRLGISVEYSDFDLVKAARARRPLEQRKLNAAIRGQELAIDRIAFDGDSNYNLKGLWSDLTNMTSVTIAATGTGSSKDWTKKTAAQIETDIVQMLSAVPDYFQGMPYSMVVSPATERLLKTKRLGTDITDTLYNLIMDKFKLAGIYSCSKFKNISALSNVGSAIIYPKDPDIVQLLIPQDRTQKAPFRDGRKTVIDFETEIAGLVKFHPKAIVYADRIGNGSDT